MGAETEPSDSGGEHADFDAAEVLEGILGDREQDATEVNELSESDGVDLGDEGDAAGVVDDGELDVETADPDESVADQIVRERAEYLDALRRLQADFENYRKRSFKQQSDAIDLATGRLVEDLLPVLDACDAGIEHGDEGVIAVFTALLGVLERSGLERLDPLGEVFDPNAHEAVMHEPGEGDEPEVAEVMRPGYRWKGRVVRAAMVKVRG